MLVRRYTGKDELSTIDAVNWNIPFTISIEIDTFGRGLSKELKKERHTNQQ